MLAKLSSLPALCRDCCFVSPFKQILIRKPYFTSMLGASTSSSQGGSTLGKRQTTARSASASPPPPSKKIRQSEPLQPRKRGVACKSQSGRTQLGARTGEAVKKANSESSKAPIEAGMWMIVGLGNPGSTYERTRHNIGFMVIDELVRSENIECRKLEKSAAVGKGEISGRQVLLVKPVTFMNNSGESVGALSKFYKIPPSRILVISDDLDQPTAAVKLKPKGGHGGHNGLRSIIERMGNSQEFPRIKIGIGRPSGQLPVPSYVLQDFSKKEEEEINVAVRESADIVRSILALGLEKALSGVRA